MVRTAWRILVGIPEEKGEKGNQCVDDEKYLDGFQTGHLWWYGAEFPIFGPVAFSACVVK